MGIIELISSIVEVHEWFANATKIHVNKNLTIRNWIFGLYIVEYELKGNDRAQYGKRILIATAEKLNNAGLKELNDRYLRNCKTFYKLYPQIWMTVSSKSFPEKIINSVSKKIASSNPIVQPPNKALKTGIIDKLNHLSFSHFVELIKIQESLKREFYEVSTIGNNWSVRELRRALNSLMFERVGYSRDKKSIIEEIRNQSSWLPSSIVKDPYVLEFLGLEEKPSYSETDLEEAILNHLQKFLLELGKGFCFEARQKRISFDNRHYKIDLVFYHRILKCHVLFDLKIGEFDHSDPGQMNMYLNLLYREL